MEPLLGQVPFFLVTASKITSIINFYLTRGCTCNSSATPGTAGSFSEGGGVTRPPPLSTPLVDMATVNRLHMQPVININRLNFHNHHGAVVSVHENRPPGSRGGESRKSIFSVPFIWVKLTKKLGSFELTRGRLTDMALSLRIFP